MQEMGERTDSQLRSTHGDLCVVYNQHEIVVRLDIHNHIDMFCEDPDKIGEVPGRFTH